MTPLLTRIIRPRSNKVTRRRAPDMVVDNIMLCSEHEFGDFCITITAYHRFLFFVLFPFGLRSNNAITLFSFHSVSTLSTETLLVHVGDTGDLSYRKVHKQEFQNFQ